MCRHRRVRRLRVRRRLPPLLVDVDVDVDVGFDFIAIVGSMPCANGSRNPFFLVMVCGRKRFNIGAYFSSFLYSCISLVSSSTVPIY